MRIRILIILTLFYSTLHASDCDMKELSEVFLSDEFVAPSSCALPCQILLDIELQHSIAYGKTERAKILLDKLTQNDTTFADDFTLIKILNLHGKHDEAMQRLKNIDSSLIVSLPSSYENTLTLTYLRLGDLNTAREYFNNISKALLNGETKPIFEIIKYELLIHEGKYEELIDEVDQYLSELVPNEGIGNPGFDTIIISYLHLGICKTNEDQSEEGNRVYLINALNEHFAKSSVYHSEVDRIISQCE